MKKFLTFLVFLILFAALGIVGYLAYLHFQKTEQRSVMSVVPRNAVFMIETQNLTKAWQNLTESHMWGNLTKTKYFSDFDETVTMVDEYFRKNGLADLALNGRPLLASSHMVSGSDFGFLFVIDLKEVSVLKALKSGIHLTDFKVEERKYKEVEITEIQEISPGVNMYMSFIDNVMVASMSSRIVEEAITQSQFKMPLNPTEKVSEDELPWELTPAFVEATGSVAQSKLFNFYVNYAQMPRFISAFMTEKDPMVESLGHDMTFSAFNMDFADEMISMEGATLLDSLPSYLNAISQVKPGKMKAQRVISNQAAVLVSITFDSFAELLGKMKEQFASENADDMKGYEENIKMVEKLMGVNMEHHFFNWIGNEIAFAKLRPTKNTRVEDVLVAIHAKSADSARVGLEHIMKRLRQRSPVKFKSKMHRNYEIHYLEMKGFFKLFFGKMFGKLEKPYFTFVEDYVLFSNSEKTLQENLNHYINAMTLSRNGDFMDFKDNFRSKSNVNVFVQMPKAYANMYHYSNGENRKALKENKEVILNFARLGMQMVSNSGMLKTYVMAVHDSMALKNDELEKLDVATSEEMFNKQVERKEFMVISDSLHLPEGEAIVHYPDSVSVKFEGKIVDGKLEGLGRYFYQNGNLLGTVNYKDGKLEGEATFYFNDAQQTRKALLTFGDDKIEGDYLEFYKTGARKALLKYEDGIAEGDAQFFFTSGILQIEGKYKNGLKHGKWEFFDEKGERIGKEKWKKGVKKK